MAQNWRTKFNHDSSFRGRVDERVARVLADALEAQKRRGLVKYGADFVGDPLEHALEEALGLAAYLATEIEVRRLAKAEAGEGVQRLRGMIEELTQ